MLSVINAIDVQTGQTREIVYSKFCQCPRCKNNYEAEIISGAFYSNAFGDNSCALKYCHFCKRC